MNNAPPATARGDGSPIRETARHLRWRYLKDVFARYAVLIGGMAVIGALLLIFVYLLSETLPLFRPAHAEARLDFAPAANGPALFLGAEEQGDVGFTVLANGELRFQNLRNGEPRKTLRLPIAERSVLRVIDINAAAGERAAVLSDGSVLPFRNEYKISYPDNQRYIDPQLSYPLGETPLMFDAAGPANTTARIDRDDLWLAGTLPDGEVLLRRYEQSRSLFGDTSEISAAESQRITPAVPADWLLIDPQARWLYLAARDSGRIALYQLGRNRAPVLVDTVDAGGALADIRFLSGGVSVISARRDGEVLQWFPAQHAGGERYLAHVRDFAVPGDSAVTATAAEQRRRVFAVGNAAGAVTLFHATADRRLLSYTVSDQPISRIAFSPRPQTMLVEDASGRVHVVNVEDEHPEVSLSALWGRVWYESYDQPRFLWQSSAATEDFEPKFSLTPISFGTLKAAFYAMLFAVPLAILGAIFTANFMSAQMRQWVKPTVELMEALPTVILGFLAGLWLAPFVEKNLAGMFLMLLFLPLSIPLFGYAWMRAPRSLRFMVPAGWEAALMIPVIVVIVWVSFALAKPVEAIAFGGNLQIWMDHTFGIGYDQRNAMVVGIAMGVAVIPTIYSITEDAIFSVPKHLSLGSLALGATPWQTLVGVVLPTASPGIFSAVMIGLGRAVGETMIVLMATGNTPVMDFSLFSGMRTLSANIAVEMPESEVGSTHFRLLFVAGLVLFIFTFLFNTLAEMVRQRLRRKYASI